MTIRIDTLPLNNPILDELEKRPVKTVNQSPAHEHQRTIHASVSEILEPVFMVTIVDSVTVITTAEIFPNHLVHEMFPKNFAETTTKVVADSVTNAHDFTKAKSSKNHWKNPTKSVKITLLADADSVMIVDECTQVHSQN